MYVCVCVHVRVHASSLQEEQEPLFSIACCDPPREEEEEEAEAEAGVVSPVCMYMCRYVYV